MTSELRLLQAAKKIGFLYSGGSARCVFQTGATEVLYSLGIEPSICLGVSAGSWNAAAVAAGRWQKLRTYWKFFCRMPYIDVRNLLREHTPFIWPRLHDRAFERYVGVERLRAASTLPLYVCLTRLRDKQRVIMDVKAAADPFAVLLTSNYLPPFYTHPVPIDGEKYGDGGFADNAPYDFLFDQGCDAVVIFASKGESEGGLYRNNDDFNHVIPSPYRERTVVIRPRHRMPLGFVERRWEKLGPIAELGALRAREVLLGERHPETDMTAGGRAFSSYFVRFRDWLKRRERSAQPH